MQIWRDNNSNTVKTSDPSLAAYLFLKNIRLVTIEFENDHGFFIFETGEDPDGLAQQFLSSEYPPYYQAYRSILNRLHQAKRKQESQYSPSRD